MELVQIKGTSSSHKFKPSSNIVMKPFPWYSEDLDYDSIKGARNLVMYQYLAPWLNDCIKVNFDIKNYFQ